MIVFKKILAIQSYLDTLRNQGLTIGFVPTMGALHKGHFSLIETSKKACEITVCSIFVNPTQFNQKSDFEKYPSTINKDLIHLLELDTDIVFLPDAGEMYPNGETYVMSYDLDGLDKILEGAKRPGHFEGVIQVVDLLLNIIRPNKLFMGQKDYQQFSIIQKMLELQKSEVELVVCPIFRENDGLAMSSRNVRLTELDRLDALQLNKALLFVKNNVANYALEDLLNQAQAFFASPNINLEYFLLVNSKTLQPVKKYKKSEKLVALVAAWVGKVRLIDNMIISG